VKYVDSEKIKGETIDLDYCYILDKDKLYKYGKLIPDKIIFDDELIKLFDVVCYETGCDIVRNANIFHTPHKYFHSNNTKSGSDISDDFEICLDKPSYVNHIATMGAKPDIQVYKIVNSYNIVDKIDQSSNIVKYQEINEKDYKYDLMSVVDPETLSWVEDFELLYQDMKTKQWRSLGKFVGNTNACDIKLNSFNMVYTDKFLIVPLSIHNSQSFESMRVALFGLSTDKIEQHMHYKKYIFCINATKKLAQKAEILRKRDLYLNILHKSKHEVQQNKPYRNHHYKKLNGRLNKYPAYNEWKYEQNHIFEDDYDE